MNIKILGGGREVGRVAVEIKDGNGSILLDYGVNFDERDTPRMPAHIRPIDIKALIISHAHLDHVGAAPYLFISGNPRAISTKPTLDVAKLLIIDFLRLNSYYVEYELREFDRLYDNTVFVNYGEEASIDGYSIRLYNAGHIIGSALTYIETPKGNKVLYTGDFNTIQTWTLSPAETPPLSPDVIIAESTYGGRNHPRRHLVEKRLVEIVEETTDRGGVVLIPAFSVGRSQEVMALLYSQAPYLDIYIDGMSRDITELYVKHRAFLRDPNLFQKITENVNFVVDSSMRRKIWKKPCVIIASAGMMKGGPSLYYLKQIHGNPRNTVILVSYQSPNSNGHRVLETGELKELGIEAIKARVEWLDLSSHAGRDDIVKFIARYKHSVKHVVLVHGSLDDATELSSKIREALGEDVEITIPDNNQEVEISH